MSLSKVIFGAAYIGPYTEWSWVNVIAFILVGIMLFWILYTLVLSRIRWKKSPDEEEKKVERVVITGQDRKDENGISPICEKEEDIEAEEVIVMPFEGELVDLNKVPDPLFSEKMLGDGFAITPSRGEIIAPVNGVVKEIQAKKKSIAFETNAGRDVILYIGLNTVPTGETGISLDIKEGMKVKAGHQIGTVDLGKLNLQTKSIISPVVFPSLKKEERIVIKEQGIVDAGMEGVVVIEIKQ